MACAVPLLRGGRGVLFYTRLIARTTHPSQRKVFAPPLKRGARNLKPINYEKDSNVPAHPGRLNQ